MNARPSSLSPFILGANVRTTPVASKIRYNVLTGKPYPNQFTKDGKRKTNTKIRKREPKTSCPIWEFAPSASSKHWYGSSTLPNSNIQLVLNPAIGFACPGFNKSFTYTGFNNSVAHYADFEDTATLQDPFPSCSSHSNSNVEYNNDNDINGDEIYFYPQFDTEGFPNNGDDSQIASIYTFSGEPNFTQINDNMGNPGIILGDETFILYETVIDQVKFAMNQDITFSFRTKLPEVNYTCWFNNASGSIENNLVYQPGFSLSMSEYVFGFLMYYRNGGYPNILACDINEFFDENWHDFVIVFKGSENFAEGEEITSDLLDFYIDGTEYETTLLEHGTGTYPENPDDTVGTNDFAYAMIGIDPFIMDGYVDGGCVLSELKIQEGLHPPSVPKISKTKLKHISTKIEKNKKWI